MKLCKTCGNTKEDGDFGRNRETRDNMSVSCKQCMRERSARWYLENKAKKIADAKAWADANSEKRRAIGREWRRANPDVARAWAVKNRDIVRTLNKKYRNKNIDRVRARVRLNNKQRRAVKKRIPPRWASQQAIASIYAEAEILTKETGILHHVDHLVPLISPKVCGLHCEANLRVVPAAVNLAKGNRFWPDMF